MDKFPTTTDLATDQVTEEPPLHGRLHYKILLATLLCAAPLIFGVDYLFYRNLRRDKIAEQGRHLQHIAATTAALLDLGIAHGTDARSVPALASRLQALQRANELEQPIDLFYWQEGEFVPVFYSPTAFSRAAPRSLAGHPTARTPRNKPLH